MGLHVPEGYHFLGEWGRAWRDPKSGLWTVAGMREGSEGRVVLSDGEARAFARLVCRDEPATFATPAENETAMNASGREGQCSETAGHGTRGVEGTEELMSTELSTFILHRDTGVTDPERPFKSQCSCGRWFTALDWHLHGCWSGCSHVQYDEPPSVLHEYERFLAYDLLSEALGRAGVLAPIRYEHPSRMGRGRRNSCVV